MNVLKAAKIWLNYYNAHFKKKYCSRLFQHPLILINALKILNNLKKDVDSSLSSTLILKDNLDEFLFLSKHFPLDSNITNFPFHGLSPVISFLVILDYAHR